MCRLLAAKDTRVVDDALTKGDGYIEPRLFRGYSGVTRSERNYMGYDAVQSSVRVLVPSWSQPSSLNYVFELHHVAGCRELWAVGLASEENGKRSCACPM